jgi:hypothetical protein
MCRCPAKVGLWSDSSKGSLGTGASSGMAPSASSARSYCRAPERQASGEGAVSGRLAVRSKITATGREEQQENCKVRGLARFSAQGRPMRWEPLAENTGLSPSASTLQFSWEKQSTA